MAEGFMVSYDEILGTEQWVHEDGDKVYLETRDPFNTKLIMAEDVANERKMFDERSGWKGDIHKIGTIPLEIWYTLPRDLRNDEKALRKWLDGPGAIWKTRPGKLSK